MSLCYCTFRCKYAHERKARATLNAFSDVYCVCSEAAVCESVHLNKRWAKMMGWKDGTEILIGSGLVCVFVCVLAVSAEIQSRCGSAVVHSHVTCQAGGNVGQTPWGISSIPLSLPLPLIHSHSLSVGKPPEETLTLSTNSYPLEELVHLETMLTASSQTLLLHKLLQMRHVILGHFWKHQYQKMKSVVEFNFRATLLHICIIDKLCNILQHYYYETIVPFQIVTPAVKCHRFDT